MIGTAQAPPLAYAAQLGAHVVSADEVVLLSERDRFALTGRLHVALAPLLDGTRSADELVDALAGAFPPAHVHLALMRLQGQGFVVAVDDAAARAAGPLPAGPLPSAPAFAGTPLPTPLPPHALGSVAAAGVPPEWATRLARELGVAGADAARGAGGGVTADDTAGTASLRVLLLDDYLRPELAAAAASALASGGGALLPVRPVGRCLWFGPLLHGPAAAPGWELFGRRLRMNRYADVTALERGATLPLFPADRAPATVALALSIAAALAGDIGAGRTPGELVDGMLTYDVAEQRFERHPLARIAPPRDDVAPAFGAALPPLTLHDEPTRFDGDGGHRTRRPAETLARLRELISPITGIVGAIEPVSGFGGMHVFSAVHPQAPVVTRPQGRTLGRKGGSMGKGFDADQARVSCLGEAVERYSGGFFGDEPRRRARYEEIAEIAIHPDRLLLFSDAQHAAAETARAGGGDPQAADAVPARFDATQAIDWVPVSSLVDGATRWLPAAYAYFGYGASDVGGYRGAPFCVADSNGCAAGNTREEAILQGLLELIERDACGIAWHDGTPRPAIDLDSFGEPAFTRAREAFAARGRELHVLDLRVDTEVPVALAVTWNRADGLGTRFALGCHLDPRIAVSRALSELAQLVLDDPAADAALGEELFAEQSIDAQPHLQATEGPALTASALPSFTRETIAAELTWCCELLAARGLDVLVLDQTRPEVSFPVVRVTVPGLRHFWRRLAPGRLYDVPVTLGWRAAPLREDELNPLPVLI
ncbi:MAG TPA: TOMM precursor leader peptide-binding protein [Conexibacter sp.]|nr:TOMM precursor leader peptide-binding protein [Conexibacter sp.]